MANKVAAEYVGKVSWKNDIASMNKLKRETKDLKKELEGIKPPKDTPIPGSPPSPRQRRQQDAHIKEGMKFFRQQNAFLAKRARMTEDFLTTNRKITADNREDVRNQLMQTNSAVEFRSVQKQINRELMDTQERHRRNLRKLQQQNFAVKRMRASVAQLAGGFISAFAAADAGAAVIRTGVGFEAVNKTMLAVSANSEEAKENFEFLRAESKRLGLDIVESGKAFGKMLGGAGGAVPIEQMRESFTAMSEAGVVLGLSTADQAGALRGLQQSLSKGKFLAEEVTGQMAERIPFVREALEKGAQSAGLLSKNLSGTELTQAFFKLMQNGEAIAVDILPFFNKELRDLANNNDAVANAIRFNLAPALGSANANLQELQNSVFKGGVKNAVMFLLNGFNSTAEQAQGLATFIGGALAGALTAVGTVVRFVTAAFLDLRHIIHDITGITQAGENKFLAQLGTIVGAIGAVVAAWKGIQAIRRGRRDRITEKDILEDAGIEDKGGILTRRGHSPRKPLYVAVVGDLSGTDGDIDKKRKQGGKTSSRGSRGGVRGMLGEAVEAAVGMKDTLLRGGKGLLNAAKFTPQALAITALTNTPPPRPNQFIQSGMAASIPPEELKKLLEKSINVEVRNKVTVNPSEEFGQIMRAEAEGVVDSQIQNSFQSMTGGE